MVMAPNHPMRYSTRNTMPSFRNLDGPGAVSGLHCAVGHYRHGILLAPVTGELVIAGLCGEELPPLASEFSPARFSKVHA